MSDDAILREIKWLNKPENTPKDELYEWQFIPHGCETTKLEYVSGTDTMRKFTLGTLKFTHNKGILTVREKTYEFRRIK